MPTQIASDNFARASLGSNWTLVTGSSGALGIISSTAVALTSGAASAYSGIVWAGPGSFNLNQYASLTLEALGSVNTENQIGPGVLLSASAQTGYFIQLYAGELYIHKLLAGTATNLTTALPYAPTAGDVLTLTAVVSGSFVTLVASVNGVLKIAVTDSSSPITSGSPGIYGYNYNSGGTQFEGTPWAAGNVTIGLMQFNNTAGGGTTIAYLQPNTAGDFLLLCLRTPTTTTVTDNAGSKGGSGNNTWLKAVGVANSPHGMNFWYVPNCQGTTSPITVTLSTTAAASACAEFMGLATTSAAVLGNTASAKSSSNSTAYAVAGIATTAADVLVVGAVANEIATGLNDTPSGGFGDVQNSDQNLFMALQFGGAATYTYGGTLSSSVNWAAAAAIFNGPTTVVPIGEEEYSNTATVIPVDGPKVTVFS